MNRRQLLAGLGSAAFVSVSGCTTDRSGDGTTAGSVTGNRHRRANGEATTNTGTDRTGTSTPRASEVELPVPESELNRGAHKDAIPAITEPAFGDSWAETSSSTDPLNDDDAVIGVEQGGETRAYPLRILDWHEVVNDRFDGPLLVTYCPLCGSGVTAKRRVEGEETAFGVSGLLWRSDLVMYDELTDSLWSQILGTAIRGAMTGTALTLVPSSFTTWDEWRDSHPDTSVLLPPPISETVSNYGARNYDRDPYDSYSENRTIGIGYNEFDDERLHPKATVVGVTASGSAKAYPLDAVGENAIVDDVFSGRPLVVTTTAEGSLYAYDRAVDGERLQFENHANRYMRADGSRWAKPTGKAVDGPHEGTRLSRANDRTPMFWFAWLDFHPETALYTA